MQKIARLLFGESSYHVSKASGRWGDEMLLQLGLSGLFFCAIGNILGEGYQSHEHYRADKLLNEHHEERRGRPSSRNFNRQAEENKLHLDAIKKISRIESDSSDAKQALTLYCALFGCLFFVSYSLLKNPAMSVAGASSLTLLSYCANSDSNEDGAEQNTNKPR